MKSAIEREIRKRVAKLAEAEQRHVLDLARNLGEGARGSRTAEALLRLVGTISPEDLAAMSKAIEEGCEQVNLDEW